MQDAYKRLLLPFLEREWRRRLKQQAEDEAFDTYRRNLKKKLMLAPLRLHPDWGHALGPPVSAAPGLLQASPNLKMRKRRKSCSHICLHSMGPFALSCQRHAKSNSNKYNRENYNINNGRHSKCSNQNKSDSQKTPIF